MLFDLRGRGRRRTIQLIYLFLAILLGGGLIFFGIGGGAGSGGLLNAVNNGGAGSSNFNARMKRDERLAAQQPNNAAAWAKVATDHAQLAGLNANSTTGAFSNAAIPDLRAAQQAWTRYTTLTPTHPDPHLAIVMTRPLLALNDFGGAAAAFDIFVNSQPASANLYATLAEYRYLAHETPQGDLAAQKAVALAPKAQQATLKQELDSIKKNPNGAAGTAGGAATGGTTTG